MTTETTFAADEALSAIPREPVESSQVESIGHDEAMGILVVKFKKGGLYAYADVPRSKFSDMKASESVGGYLGKHIKGKHEFKRIPE